MNDKQDIDLNADLGEGHSTDGALMPLLDSCSIACGGHAGDTASMESTMLLAKQHQVHAGPHPAYPDREHFGRRVLDITPGLLHQSLIEQLMAYKQLSDRMHIPVHHVKLHGALYHRSNSDPATATVVWESITRVLAPCKIYLPPDSEMRFNVPRNWEVWTEAFLDRAYRADLSLVPRDTKGAVLASETAVLKRLEDLTNLGGVHTLDGEFRNLKADTACLHGDHPQALRFATAISKRKKRI